VLITYVGEPKCPVNAAHGNAVKDRPYLRTNPSVLEKIKQIASENANHAGPAKLYKGGSAQF